MSAETLPSRCPVCHVVWPGTCRNENGDKILSLNHPAHRETA